MAAPVVSIVVPNYNHARFLPRRIDSILDQTFQDFELILLDDFSTDDSRTLLSRYASDPRVRLEFNTANSGSAFKQWNKGVRLAHGKYIWMAESDDYAGERFLETMVASLEQDASITFAYCRSWRVTDDDRVDGLGDWYLEEVDADRWKSDFVMEGREFARSYLSRSPVVPNASAALFRKASYQAVGGADEALRLCGDWKVWASLALDGKVAFNGNRLNYFRYHGANVRARSAQSALDVLEKLSVMRWILEQSGATPAELAHAQREASNLWVPAVLSFRVPAEVKRQILAAVRRIDPHPMRRFARPALFTVQRKVARHWPGAARYATPKSA